MKVMIVVGARPNFMKAAPIIKAIHQRNNAEPGEAMLCTLVHTGQHYDRAMSDAFFTDLNMTPPDVHLGIGSGSHAAQTADIMRKFEEVLLREQPDVLVVVGDVNSTVACALVAAKISFDDSGRRPLIAHVEAGLRSFDRSMPEEINRILTDQLADLLFVTEESGMRNLAAEGVPAQKIHFVGNTMIDSLLAYQDRADASIILENLCLRDTERATRPYVLLTLHRPANVDNRDAFLNILGGLEVLAKTSVVVFPAHPRTQKRILDFGLGHYFTLQASVNGNHGGIRMIEPLGYLDFLCLMKNARLVVTDSGGIQEETTCLGVPCVTVRENTERPVTLESGTNVLAGVRTEAIRQAVARQLARQFDKQAPEKWDGNAAVRIVRVLLSSVASQSACACC